ncbi:MAG: sugar phosphate isomerase/epimerase [Syntrophorhabdaceae bacterium]|nr:sugar phosphate isomerase/epimerase [Syntrophorhabdaceae bacterium]
MAKKSYRECCVMKFGLSTYFLVKKHIKEIVKDILDHGFNTIEISYEIPHSLEMDRDFFKYLKGLKGDGVEFSMHAPFLEINFGSYFEDMRNFSKKRVMEALNFAEIAECSPFVIHPCYSFVRGKAEHIEKKTWENFIEDLKEIVNKGKEKGIEIGLENVQMPFFFFYNMEDFLFLQKEIPELTIALDLGHAYISKSSKGTSSPEESIIEDIKKVGLKNIAHIHLHNNSGKRDDHTIMEGSMDIKKILKFLFENGYDKKVIIESQDFEEYGMDMVMKKIKELGYTLKC